MINVVIDGIDFGQMENMKYWAPPSSWSPERAKMEVKNRIFSGEWYGARKMDGAWFKLSKDMDGVIRLTGRSRGVGGDFLDKIENVPHIREGFANIPNGSVLLGEIVFPDDEGSKRTTTIMGCLPEKAVFRQKSHPISYYVFDAIAWDGKSWLNKPAKERFNFVSNQLPQLVNDKNIICAKYVTGAEMWDELQDILANGGEGMVFTHGDAHYEPGKRPSKTTMKVKQALKQTVDCIVIGANPATEAYTGKLPETWTMWKNMRTGELLSGLYYRESLTNAVLQPVSKNYFNGWCGSWKLGLYEGGKLVYYGDVSGLTEEQKENWESYVGRVVEIGGMQIDTESKVIRHPKLLSIRPVGDKDPKDCTVAQLD